MYIPYGTQWIDEEDIKAVTEALNSDYLTTGPKVREFEQAVAEYTGAKYAVAVSNGTAALHLACLAAGIGPNDEVITTPITFAASANCVLYCQGKPVFADIDPKTYNISPESIREKITKRTKAIIPVHFTGQPCDMDEIHRIAKEYGLLVIEDAAHALGADYKGKRIGSLSDMTTFSFHPVKHITTCEGGMITTNDEVLYHKLSLLSTHGITREESYFEKQEGGWYYEQQMLGYNYRISDIQCALGISQFKRLDMFLKYRRQIAERYFEELKGVDKLTLPFQQEGRHNSWHLYVIQTKEDNRRLLFDQLREHNIGVNVHYIPVYHHPYYQKNGYQDVWCEHAEHLYKGLISLPMYPKLYQSTNDLKDPQGYVIDTIKSLFS